MNVIEFNLNKPDNDHYDSFDVSANLTELGNAYKMLEYFGDNLVICNNEWHEWDGSKWINLGTDGAIVKCLELPELIRQDILKYPLHSKQIVKWSDKTRSHKVMSATSKIMQMLPEFKVKPNFFDSNLDICGMADASLILNLKSGSIEIAKKSDRVTKSIAINMPDFEDTCQLWLNFLYDIFQGDTELISWLQKFLGYCLTGHASEEIMLYCLGGGSNGKTIFMHVIKDVIGSYLVSSDASLLSTTNRSSEAASPALASLRGARVVFSPELDDKMSFNEALLKNLVSSQDMITARHMYGSPISFKPTWKIIMSGNSEPRVSGTDKGIWRRLKVLPFNMTYEGDNIDSSLSSKLSAERSKIMLWMLEGAARWYKEGLKDIPTVIRVASDAYKTDQDIIGAFLTDHYIVEKNKLGMRNEVLLKSVYKQWELWCQENGYKPGGSNNFSRKLGMRGLDRRLSANKVSPSVVYDLIPI